MMSQAWRKAGFVGANGMESGIQIAVTPWALFRDWFAEAEAAEVNDPNAMSLATVSAAGAPSVRIVLLKDYDMRGFCFFTNRESRKGDDLAANARGALCWHWKSLRRQVRAEGSIAMVSDTESDAYFAMRPRGSQIGAWASLQSQHLPARADFDKRIADCTHQFEGRAVPRPPHWGGYRLTPNRVEFWQDQPSRLHDRLVYTCAPGATNWATERLYP